MISAKIQLFFHVTKLNFQNLISCTDISRHKSIFSLFSFQYSYRFVNFQENNDGTQTKNLRNICLNNVFSLLLQCLPMSGCFGGNDWADNLIYIKRRLQNALVLTGVNFANSTISQEQSSVNALLGVYIHPVLSVLSDLSDRTVCWVNYIFIFRGAFSVARFDLSGNAKAYFRGTSKRTGSTILFV